MYFLPTLFKKFQRDNALFLARALAFDVVVCLIPAIFLLFVLFGFLFESPRETIRYMTPYLKAMIPFSSQQVLLNLFAVVKAKKVLGFVGVVGLLWTLSRVFGSRVNIQDTTMVAVAFGSKPGDADWNAIADLDRNGVINILDITMVAKDYGKTL